VVVPPEPHHGSSLTPFEGPTRRASDRAINVDVIFQCCRGPFARWHDPGPAGVGNIAYRRPPACWAPRREDKTYEGALRPQGCPS